MSDTHIHILPKEVSGLPGIYGEMEEYGLVKVNYPYVFSVEDGHILTCLSCENLDVHCDEHCYGCFDCVGDSFFEFEPEPEWLRGCHCDGTSLRYCDECRPIGLDEVPF